MQQAARRVAQENARLRIMLGRHGVTDAQVDVFLQSFQDGAADSDEAVRRLLGIQGLGLGHDAGNRPLKMALPPLRKASRPTSPARTKVSTPSSQSRASRNPTPGDRGSHMTASQSHEAASMPWSAATAARSDPTARTTQSGIETQDLVMEDTPSGQQRCCNGKTTCVTASPDALSTATPATVDAEASTTPTTAASDPSYFSSASPTQMSCTAAAKIIAEMQGHGDLQRAKANLGCQADQECLVKNISLFQALESENA